MRYLILNFSFKHFNIETTIQKLIILPVARFFYTRINGTGNKPANITGHNELWRRSSG
jgi:hypothetical protein